MGISVEPRSAMLGAVVSGVDVVNASDKQIDEIYNALLDHGVIFIQDQMLTDEEQQAFASRFGELSVFPVSKFFGRDATITRIEDSPDSPPKAGEWHTDVTWISEPPKMGFLQAIDIPNRGGGTMWSCLYAAYDALSPAMAEFCESLIVEHVISNAILEPIDKMVEGSGPKVKAAFPPVVHPLVRTHPDTQKKALFVAGGFMRTICELSAKESDTLLRFLFSHIKNENFHIRWEWQPGDLAIWDERCTNHLGLEFHYPMNRAVRRCTIDGDKPYFDPDAKPLRNPESKIHPGMSPKITGDLTRVAT